MKKNISLIATIILVIIVIACKKTKNNEDPSNPINLYESFDRKAMLTNQADNVIIPAWLNFQTQTDSLVNAVNRFNLNTNNSNLQALQSQYNLTYQALKINELYQFGIVENQLLWATLDFWPAREIDINNFIINNTTITEPLIASKGTTVKGMPVIEYLIFDNINGNLKIVNDFNISSDAVKRKDYLLSLAQNLKNTVTLIKNDWQTNYRTTFINNDAQGLSGSINISINRCIQLANFIKDMKIGKPFGKRDGNLYPNELEAIQSKQSLEAIKNNLKGLENLLKGKSNNGPNGLGYDDFLNHLNAKSGNDALWPKIENQINVCYAKVNAINIPMQDALTQDVVKVNELYISLKQLLVLIQVDMVSNLGITLTFTDSDGD